MNVVRKAADLEFDNMRVEHLEDVLKIEEQCFPTPWSKNAFTHEIEYNNLAHYIVALKDGEIIGYAGMWVILDDAHITNIAVSPLHRGKGYGKCIMREMMRRALLLGASKMTLEVRTSNEPARRLYSSLGFVERGRRKKYYSDTGEDAIIMWKDSLTDSSLELKNAKVNR